MKRRGHILHSINHGLCRRGLSRSCCPQELEPLLLTFLGYSPSFLFYTGLLFPDLHLGHWWFISLDVSLISVSISRQSFLGRLRYFLPES